MGALLGKLLVERLGASTAGRSGESDLDLRACNGPRLDELPQAPKAGAVGGLRRQVSVYVVVAELKAEGGCAVARRPVDDLALLGAAHTDQLRVPGRIVRANASWNFRFLEA